MAAGSSSQSVRESLRLVCLRRSTLRPAPCTCVCALEDSSLLLYCLLQTLKLRRKLRLFLLHLLQVFPLKFLGCVLLRQPCEPITATCNNWIQRPGKLLSASIGAKPRLTPLFAPTFLQSFRLLVGSCRRLMQACYRLCGEQQAMSGIQSFSAELSAALATLRHSALPVASCR